MASWSASTAFIVVEGISGPKALGESWRATEGSRVTLTVILTLAFLAIVVAMVALFGGIYFLAGGFEAAAEEASLAEIIPSNILASAISVAGWLFGAAVYRLVRPIEGVLEDVFA
jgi:hypothetical protein